MPDQNRADAELRRQAEGVLGKSPENMLRLTRDNIRNMAPEAMQELLHEFQIHQIELKMQNEALRKTQEELENARLKYYHLYDSAPIGYITVDEKGFIRESNLMAGTLLGQPRATLAGRKFSDFVRPEYQDVLYLHRRRSCQSEGQQACEIGLKNGVHVQLNTLADKQGSCRIAISDISSLRKMGAELEQARDAAQAASRAKSEFLANMSHEIRTPMTAVMGLSELLARSTPLTPQQKEFTDTLKTSADALMSLLDDLLNFSKIETGSITLVESPFRLDLALQNVVDIIGVQARKKNVRLTVSNACASAFIGDAGKLRQIIMNLCSNAVKFTDPSGNVRIDAHEEPSLKEGWKNIIIKVRDTGIGISPQDQKAIFQKFVQLDSGADRRHGGTGLGLAIAKMLTERMGGELSVESSPGKGSTFTICVPLRKQEGVAPEPSKMPLGKAKRLPKCDNAPVLLVEDHDANILVTESFLKYLGYKYDVARSGKEALKKFSLNRYSLIIMDLQMPEMDGIETTRHIRSMEKEKNLEPTRILAVTGNATEDKRVLSLNVGMNDFLSKPFRPQELETKLKSLAA
jgi:PAS domain S-box-containing protein